MSNGIESRWYGRRTVGSAINRQRRIYIWLRHAWAVNLHPLVSLGRKGSYDRHRGMRLLPQDTHVVGPKGSTNLAPQSTDLTHPQFCRFKRAQPKNMVEFVYT